MLCFDFKKRHMKEEKEYLGKSGVSESNKVY